MTSAILLNPKAQTSPPIETAPSHLVGWRAGSSLLQNQLFIDLKRLAPINYSYRTIFRVIWAAKLLTLAVLFNFLPSLRDITIVPGILDPRLPPQPTPLHFGLADMLYYRTFCD